MKIAKSEVRYIIQLVISWTVINLMLNLFGLWLTKRLNAAEFTNLDSLPNEFLKPLIIQSFLFAIFITLGYLFLKSRKLAVYSFVALQFVVFHIIFFLNVKIHNGMHFESTVHNPGLKYLSYCGQYLVDILYLYFPINGDFDNGVFMPDRIGTFYIHWILLSIVYYAGLTWVATKIIKTFFGGGKIISG